jgi:hypothetical protein
MKTINLKGISNPLSEGEMKDVKGGAQPGSGGFDQFMLPNDDDAGAGVTCPEGDPCKGKNTNDSCTCNGKSGYCWSYPFAGMKCKLN